MSAAGASSAAEPRPAEACTLSGQLARLVVDVERRERDKEARARLLRPGSKRQLILSAVPVGKDAAMSAKDLRVFFPVGMICWTDVKCFNAVLSRLAADGLVRFVQGGRCRLYYRNGLSTGDSSPTVNHPHHPQ